MMGLPRRVSKELSLRQCRLWMLRPPAPGDCGALGSATMLPFGMLQKESLGILDLGVNVCHVRSRLLLPTRCKRR